MCKSCDGFAWSNNYFLADAVAYADVVTSEQLSALGVADKNLDALPVDGVGDIKLLPPAPVGLFVVTADEAGNGKGLAPGNPTLTVDSPQHRIGSVGTNGDQDFYQVELVAGQVYQIGMYGYTGPIGSPGPGGAPLLDSYIEIYAADGTTLITSADGGANTPANTANSGFDVLLTFTATTTGTYYINARSYDNDPTDGTTGEGVGDYELFVNTVDPNDPSIYRPFYDVDSPLYALDWGTQVDGTTRNPDGNVAGTDSTKGETIGHWGQSTEGKNVIKIYFAKAGDVYTPENPTSPGIPPAIVAVGAKDFEINAVWISLREFEKVADIVYVETQNRDEADFHYVTYTGTPGPGVSLLGSMSPPQESDEGLAQFNSGDSRWNATNLAQGGFSFVTLIHEFGHGHGMSHPHDNGGRSGIMNGVEAEGPAFDYTTGDFDLNQGVFTMMSYEDGWQKSPHGNAPTNVGYGYLGGLMAFDIAVIQDKYGVNEEWATGDNVYELKDVNAAGTFYSSIWDGGGTDEIRYTGARNTTIDLREATLKYEVGGGGFMSYAAGIFGGFTVAKGVTIENATSGDGADTLRGNAADNVMKAGGGNDRIFLHEGGVDTVFGEGGNDYIYFGDTMTSADKVDGGAGTDTVGLIGNYDMTFSADSLVGIERLAMYTSGYTPGTAPASYKLTMIDANVGSGGFFVTAASLQSNETLIFNGSAETDGAFTVHGGAGADTLVGGAMGDYLIGNAGADQLFGLAGNDALVGGAGADQLRGGAGVDYFRYLSTSDSTAEAMDTILDFASGGDKIDLSAIDAITGGGNDAFTFIGSNAFTAGGPGGQVRAFNVAGNVFRVEGDTDGDGTADFVIQVNLVAGEQIVATDFIL